MWVGIESRIKYGPTASNYENVRVAFYCILFRIIKEINNKIHNHFIVIQGCVDAIDIGTIWKKVDFIYNTEEL